MTLAARLRPEVSVAAVYIASMMMSVMDATIVTVALPSLGREFRAGTAGIQWVVLGYLLSLAIWIPASGWIGDRVGTKRTFLFAIGAFTIASALCSAAGSLQELVAFRFLQGVGGGMLAPVALAMLFRVFPPDRRAAAAALALLGTSIAPVIGAVLGGLLVTALSWRWIFYINLPVGVVTFIFSALFLTEYRRPNMGPFDLPGFVGSGLGLALALYVLTAGRSVGWTSPSIVAAAVGAVVSLGLFVVVELRRPAPLLNIRLLGERLFALVNLALLLGYGAFMGFLFLMPLFLQQVVGVSAFESGLTTFPESVAIAVTSPLAARLYVRYGPRRVMAFGLVLMAAVTAACAALPVDADLWVVRAMLFVLGFGMSHVFVSINTAAFARVSHAETGHASSIFSTMRQVSAATGVAVVGTVLAAMTVSGGQLPAEGASLKPGFEVAFLVDAAMMLLAAVVALAIRDADAAATMRRVAPEAAQA